MQRIQAHILSADKDYISHGVSSCKITIGPYAHDEDHAWLAPGDG